MKTLVTGAAGFIGSTLVDSLLGQGNDVVGVDAFTNYYDRGVKEANLKSARRSPRFTLVECDLATSDLRELVAECEVIFHLAGQPGVRSSWGAGFTDYARWNIVATQRLLEASRAVPLRRFVNSSSSSVYGRAEQLPTSESDLPAPISPYGVTKLAAEHLCSLYGTEFGVPTTSLRYFTVYGPRQRPDMATHRVIEAAITGRAFPMNGDGTQVRDFTFVDDAVAANLAAAQASHVPVGSVFNIGGGSMTALADVISLVEAATGNTLNVERHPTADGDPRATGANTTSARESLSWTPQVGMAEGIRLQVIWHLERRTQ